MPGGGVHTIAFDPVRRDFPNIGFADLDGAPDAGFPPSAVEVGHDEESAVGQRIVSIENRPAPTRKEVSGRLTGPPLSDAVGICERRHLPDAQTAGGARHHAGQSVRLVPQAFRGRAVAKPSQPPPQIRSMSRHRVPV